MIVNEIGNENCAPLLSHIVKRGGGGTDNHRQLRSLSLFLTKKLSVLPHIEATEVAYRPSMWSSALITPPSSSERESFGLKRRSCRDVPRDKSTVALCDHVQCEHFSTQS